MSVAGQFLNTLLSNHTLPHRCHVKTPTLSSAITTFSQPLYLCPTYSPMDILCLILTIFEGVPESYEVLRCHIVTTEEELDLFLKRVKKQNAHYLVLNINELPFKLQEVLTQYTKASYRLMFIYTAESPCGYARNL